MLKTNQKGTSNAVFIITITILIVIIGAGVAWYFINENSSENTTTNTNTEVEETSTNETQDTKQSAEITAVLANVKDGQGIGSATKSKVDGKYTLTITTEDLPDANANYIYNAWIEKKIPFNRIDAGELEKQEDGTFTLEFSSATDYSLFRTVYITLEKENKEEREDYPGEKVLSGLFTL